MSEAGYRALAARMNQFHTAAPQTDELYAILRELFSPEEAAIAALLPGHTVPAEAIAEHAGMPAPQVKAHLEAMASRGLLYGRSSKSEGANVYRLLPIMPGMFEVQMMRGERTDGKSRIAKLFDEYLRKDLMDAVHQGTPMSRVLTVEQEIAGDVIVFPYERVSEVISSHTRFALATCYCREEKGLLGHACTAPLDVCMQFGTFADFLIDRSIARPASKDDMFRALDRAEHAALVHITENAQQDYSFICNCCGCCCAMLAGITQLNRLDSIAKSNFIANVGADDCIGCAACLDRCQVDALKMPSDVVSVDQRRCIGCGLCVSSCPTRAIELRRRGQLIEPFPTVRDLAKLRKAERGLN